MRVSPALLSRMGFSKGQRAVSELASQRGRGVVKKGGILGHISPVWGDLEPKLGCFSGQSAADGRNCLWISKTDKFMILIKNPKMGRKIAPKAGQLGEIFGGDGSQKAVS